jgi:hypothetical protein
MDDLSPRLLLKMFSVALSLFAVLYAFRDAFRLKR